MTFRLWRCFIHIQQAATFYKFFHLKGGQFEFQAKALIWPGAFTILAHIGFHLGHRWSHRWHNWFKTEDIFSQSKTSLCVLKVTKKKRLTINRIINYLDFHSGWREVKCTLK